MAGDDFPTERNLSAKSAVSIEKTIGLLRAELSRLGVSVGRAIGGGLLGMGHDTEQQTHQAVRERLDDRNT